MLIEKRFVGGIPVGGGRSVREEDGLEEGAVSVSYIRAESSDGAAFLR